MKRVTQGGDINFNVADVKGLGDNYAFRFYTTDSCKYIVKVDGDAVDDIIRLEWDELKTLGDGVLNYCGDNLEPDEEYSDATFNRTFGGTTQWYIVTSCSGGGGGSSEEISELSDRLDAEIARSSAQDTQHNNLIAANTHEIQNLGDRLYTDTYTKAEVDRKIVEAEMGGDVPSGIVIDPNYVHTDNNYTTADRNKLAGLSNVGVTDTLDSESDTDALSANKGHELKEKVDYVYGRLKALFAAMGEIAFWDGKPANLLPDIDWDDDTTVKHTVTITNNVTHSVITSGGVPVIGSIQVNENSTLTLVIAPESNDYTISNVTANGGTVTDNQDGTFTVVVTVTNSDVTLTVNGNTTPTVVNYNITYGTMTNCQTTTAPTTIASDSTATIVFSVDTDYELIQSNINVTNASIVSFNNNTLVIGNAIDNVAISATATAVIPPTVEYNISYGTMTHCQTTTAPTTITDTGRATIVFSVDTNYELLQNNINVVNASIVSFNNNTLVIGSAIDNVTVSATATVTKLKFLRGYYSCTNNILGTGIATGGTDITSRVTVSQLLHVAPPETPLASDASLPHMCTFGGVSSLSPSFTYSLFTIENGVRTILGSYWCSKSVKDNLSIDFNGTGGKTSADVIAAYNAGTLYVRSTIFFNPAQTLLMRSDTYPGIRFGDSAYTPSKNGDNYEIVEIDPEWTEEQVTEFVNNFNNSTHEF